MLLMIYAVSVILTLFFSFTAGYVMRNYKRYGRASRKDLIYLVLLSLVPVLHWVLLWFAFDETLNHPWFNNR